jgi:hypothetical protein
MELSIPAGREAGEAWRALSPEARAAAWDAARRGVPPVDPGLAWAAAGYGRTRARQWRTAMFVAPAVFLVLVIGSGAAAVAVASRATGELWLSVIPMMLAVYLVVMIAMRTRFNRYQRLYSAGLLRVEAVQSGMAPVQPAAGVWDSRLTQSEFTVPYQARVPVAVPESRPPADPARAGTRVVRIRRGPLLRQFVVFAVVVALLWARGLWSGAPDGVIWMLLDVLLDGCAVAGTLLLAFSLLVSGRFLVDPVLARFTPDGWELPYARMRGPWTGVREIRVTGLRSGRRGRLAAQLSTYRVVTLVVDDPELQLAQAPPVRRYFARRALARYGSPVTIVGASNRTMPAVEMIRLVQNYTDAPVSWG